MEKVTTSGGVELERAARDGDGLDALMGWAAALLLGVAAALSALAVGRQAVRVFEARRALRQERAAWEQTRHSLERNIRLGIFGDELGGYCGFPDSRNGEGKKRERK